MQKATHATTAKTSCLERPNVAFFITHALRELQAFMDSLALRIEQIVVQQAGSPSLDPDELMRQVVNERRGTGTDRIEPPPDVPRLLLRIRLLFLVPAIETLSTVARALEGPVPYLGSTVVAMLDQFIDLMRERIERFVQRDTAARRLWELIDLLDGEHPGHRRRRPRRRG